MNDLIIKDRKREFLSLYLWQAPRTPLERQQNKETLYGICSANDN